MKSCFFIGHREVDEKILPKLVDTVRKLINEENVRYTLSEIDYCAFLNWKRSLR